MIPTFPKIFHVGDRFSHQLWDGPVEITEKVDGSQFNFGKSQGNVYMRSKGAEVFLNDENKMFDEAKSFVVSVIDEIPEGVTFHGEYLRKPKHNTLTYSRVPKGNFMLFGISGIRPDPSHASPWVQRHCWSGLLGCEAVPVLFKGEAPPAGERFEWLMSMVKGESALGNAQREGIVIKNYAQTVMVGGMAIPLLCAKMVSNEFKEKHKVAWNEGKDKIALIGEAFNAKPRWEKAIQFMRDAGQLTDSPQDIGPLLKHIHLDIEGEEKGNIKDMLWDTFSKDIKRIAVRGFPEFYKERLLEPLEQARAA